MTALLPGETDGAGEERPRPATAEEPAPGTLVPTWLVVVLVLLLAGITIVTLLIVRTMVDAPWSSASASGTSQISRLASAANADPGDVRTGLQLGFAYQEAEMPGDAIRTFERVLLHDRYNTDALYGLAMASLATGQNRRAEEALLAVLARRPAHVPAAHALGTHYLESGRFEEVLAVVGPAATDSIGISELCCLMGNAHEQLGNLEEAEECYRSALLYVPDDATACDGLSRLGLSDD